MSRPTGQLLYRETQYFAPWVYCLLALSFVGAGVALATERPPFPGAAAVVAALVISGIFLFVGMRLEIEVRTGGLYVRLFPFSWRRINLDSYTAHKVVTYRPIVDYGGWGIRFVRKGRAYNARGSRGVRIEFADGSHILLGSQKPHELAEALDYLVASGTQPVA